MEVTMHEQGDVAGYYSSSSTGDRSPHVSTATKRKRTQRHQRKAPAAPAHSSSPTRSPLDFSTEMATTTEEEDTAHCLILLAQGGAQASAAAEKLTSRRFNETATTAGGKAGFYVYECKTCNKCFPTFQALGGHRASHKKPKIAADEGRSSLPCSANPSPPAVPDGAKSRVHECSICGAEFSSGQALGGHMRRHRPILVGSATQNQEIIKKLEIRDEASNYNNSVILKLDLNLPAPCDEIGSGTVGFMFAAAATPALVDCHY